MSIIQRKQKLQRLLYLLQQQQVYTPASVAKRLNCHQSTVEKMLNQLRNESHHITFDRQLKRYKYKFDDQ